MKIIYIILAHKLPEQVVRLVRKLNTDETVFLIHVDKKTDHETYLRMANPLRMNKNVIFIKRHNCNWGDISLVKATLSAIFELRTRNISFDYAILLSGQDYPIKSNNQIKRVLEESQGLSYINYFTEPEPLAIKWLERIVYWHFKLHRWHFIFPHQSMFINPLFNRFWKVFGKNIKIRRALPLDLKPYFGGQFWCLSKECISYIQDFVKKNPSYLRFFRFSNIPDEIFFQTILLNSRYNNRLINDDLRYIRFSSQKSHPKILNIDDFEKFIHSSNLFARKFDSDIDSSVLDMIDHVT